MIWYFKHRQLIDVLLAVFAAIALYVSSNISAASPFVWLDLSNRTAFLTGLMGSCISLLGFVIAATSFLIAHLQNERFALIRRSKSWSQFIELVRSSLWRLLILSLYSGICVFAKDETYTFLAIVLVGLMVVTVAALGALIWTTSAIFTIRVDSNTR